MIEGNMAITSVLNTTDEVVVMEIPCVSWEKYTPDSQDGDICTSYVEAVDPVETKIGQSREEKVIANLRLGHLNSEEKRVIENTCRDYQDKTATFRHNITSGHGFQSELDTKTY
jgi:hypothetical protein